MSWFQAIIPYTMAFLSSTPPARAPEHYSSTTTSAQSTSIHITTSGLMNINTVPTHTTNPSFIASPVQPNAAEAFNPAFSSLGRANASTAARHHALDDPMFIRTMLLNEPEQGLEAETTMTTSTTQPTAQSTVPAQAPVGTGVSARGNPATPVKGTPKKKAAKKDGGQGQPQAGVWVRRLRHGKFEKLD